MPTTGRTEFQPIRSLATRRISTMGALLGRVLPHRQQALDAVNEILQVDRLAQQRIREF